MPSGSWFLSALLCWLLAAGPLWAKAGQVHVVRPGDTLLNIARHYQVSVQQLRQWNNLRGDRITVGQRLALIRREPKQTLSPARKVEKAAPAGKAPDKNRSGELAARFSAWSDSAISLSRRRGGYALVVNKQERYMDVYLAGERVTRFPVAIGHADAEELVDRRRANDHHLKEGLFHLSEVAWSRKIAKWDCVWMRIHTVEASKRDYAEVYGEAGRQRLEAWERVHGPIQNDAQVQVFNRAHPGAHLWRGLGIHGGGAHYDWTEGCVALDRKNVRWLYDRLTKLPGGGVGTPLVVVRF